MAEKEDAARIASEPRQTGKGTAAEFTEGKQTELPGQESGSGGANEAPRREGSRLRGEPDTGYEKKDQPEKK